MGSAPHFRSLALSLPSARKEDTPVVVPPCHLDSLDGGSPGRGIALSLRVFVSRTRLDRELAEGANPTTDPARGARADQLVKPHSRRALASALRRLVSEARAPSRSPWVATVALDRREVLGASDLLLSLADRLEEVPRPCPRAVALASFLVCDPLSPVNGVLRDPYAPLAADEHATTTQLARAALEAIETRPLT